MGRMSTWYACCQCEVYGFSAEIIQYTALRMMYAAAKATWRMFLELASETTPAINMTVDSKARDRYGVSEAFCQLKDHSAAEISHTINDILCMFSLEVQASDLFGFCANHANGSIGIIYDNIASR